MRDENLAIEEVPSGAGQRILRLIGPLVLNSFFAFQTLIREDQTDLLVLDFSAVPYIDSAGIGALVGTYVHRQKAGRNLLLVGVQPRVRTALQGHQSRTVLPLLRFIAGRGRRLLKIAVKSLLRPESFKWINAHLSGPQGRESSERENAAPFRAA